MNLTVIKNPNPADMDKYEIARAIYAETGAASLRLVEALAAMIANAASARGCSPLDVVRDENILSAAASSSPLWILTQHLRRFKCVCASPNECYAVRCPTHAPVRRVVIMTVLSPPGQQHWAMSRKLTACCFMHRAGV